MFILQSYLVKKKLSQRKEGCLHLYEENNNPLVIIYSAKQALDITPKACLYFKL